ncbi:hypothetical protein LTR86_007702 [Recurvomyces mirabilis]|nr:hypothetical protein LTR86_007702 [Recurvomyces mirabilis]
MVFGRAKASSALHSEHGNHDDSLQSGEHRTFRRPMRHCAAVALAGFVLFIVEGTAAVVVHNKVTMIASGVFDGTVLLLMLCLMAARLITSRHDKFAYHSNLVSTIMTCIATIIICMVMYPLLWYPSLNQDVLTQQVQDMQSMHPPAMAWVSIADRGDSPKPLDYPHPEGFVSDIAGGFDSTMTPCQAQTKETILAEHYCNCSESFSGVQKAPLANHVGGISYRDFIPSTQISFNTTNASLVLQVFSSHNSSGTPRDWILPGPFLLLMAFDPVMPTMEAFTSGRAQITHIPVLASTNVVIQPQYRMGWGGKPYYYYDMGITSIPSLNDICDVGDDYVTWCYTTVVLQFVDMTRTVMTRQRAASPSDIFAQVGGYFALVQFLCWIISGMALW